MDKKEILETVNALSEQVNLSGLDELEVETADFRVKLVKHSPPPTPPIPFPAPVGAQTAQPVPSQGEKSLANKQEKDPDAKIVRSPIIGTFYAAAAPDKPPFVSVGSKVTKGSIVCIVESMKLMNEITSEYDGVVTQICVNDGEAVEFDQPLIKIRA